MGRAEAHGNTSDNSVCIRRAPCSHTRKTTVDFEDPLGYEWTVVIDGVIVPLASHAVAGRVAHINWYYYGPERQYCSRVAHITLLVVWTPFERIFKRKYGYVGEPWS